MTREEYMNELYQALAGWDIETQNEIIYDFNEHFDIGREMGKSEEEVCQSLGDVHELLNEMLKEMNTSAQFTPSATSPTHSQSNSIKGSSNIFDRNFISDNTTTTFTSKMHRDGKNQLIEKVKVLLSENGRNIRCDIKIKPSADDEIHAYLDRLNEESTVQLKSSLRGDALNFYLESQHRSSSFFSFFRGNHEDLELQLELPQGMQQLDIKCDYGDTEISGLQVRQIINSNISGDLNFENVACQTMNLKSVSGDIMFRLCQVGELRFETVSGDLDFDDCQVETMKGKTVSGDLSGCLKISKLEITGVSGDIEFQVDGLQYGDIETTSGDMDLELGRELNLTCRLKSMSGDVDASLGNVAVERGHFVLGNGAGRLDCHSVSGDITLTRSY